VIQCRSGRRRERESCPNLRYLDTLNCGDRELPLLELEKISELNAVGDECSVYESVDQRTTQSNQHHCSRNHEHNCECDDLSLKSIKNARCMSTTGNFFGNACN